MTELTIEKAANAFNAYLIERRARVCGPGGSIPSHSLICNAMKAALAAIEPSEYTEDK